MGTTEAYMALQLPTLGGDPGTWDDQHNANIPKIAQHDHTTGKGLPVPTAGIGINADLTMAGYSLTNLRAACFTVQTSFSTARALWVRTSDNALVWRSAAGVDWKIADSSGINLSSTGGITGDYTAAGATIYYDDTAREYRHLEAGSPPPNSWSFVGAGGIKLYEHLTSGISNHVRLLSPAALAATYDVTFPAALPGSTQLLQVSSVGAITASNTVANAVTFSALVTASAGVTLAAGQHVTASTTGDYKHGDRVRTFAGSALQAETGWTIVTPIATSSSNTPAGYSPDFNTGDRIKSITVALFGNGVSDVTISVSVVAANPAAPTSLGSVLVTNPPASWNDTTLDLTDTALGTGESIMVLLSPNASGISVGNVRITWDRP